MTDPAARIGQQIGEYKIISILGEGGMGIVYKAEHAMIGKRVALKMLLSEYAEQPEILQRFFTEAKSVNKIGHRNIIDIFSYGQTPEGTPYFVMELLDGVELAKEIDTKGPMTVERAINIARQTASALEASHNAGILHRDLKPENIFLIPPRTPKEPEFVKVFDFGIAKLLEDNEPQLSSKTKTGVIVGTPQYMSPEQVRKQPLDARSDIYALGLIFYEMLAGRPPFLADTFPDLIVQIFTKPLPPPQEYNENIPPQISALIIKMLQLEPADRHQSMAEFIKELDNAEAELFGTSPSGSIPSVKAIEQFDESRRPKTDPNKPLIEKPTERPKKPTTLSLSATESPLQLTPKPNKSRLPLALIGGAVAALGLGLLAFTGKPEPMQAPTPAAERPQETITIDISSTPADADVLIDGQNIGKTPTSWTAPKSSEQHTLTVSLSGFEVKTKAITPNKNTELELSLVPLPTSTAAEEKPPTDTKEQSTKEQNTTKEQPKDPTKIKPIKKDQSTKETPPSDPGISTPDWAKPKN